MLLDVQMPGFSGFDVIDHVPAARRPLVVFVTAYDRYAVQAFRVHAVDYLLKPFDRARLREALARARRRLEQESPDTLVARLDGMLRDMAAHRKRSDRVLIKRVGAMTVVEVADIEWIESQGNYVALHVGQRVHLSRDLISHVERQLDPDRFVRVRRGAIVNVSRISRLEPWEKDEHVIVMASGARISVSRGFADRLEHVLARWKW
jgi:two-component system LytT family response regulator